MLGLKPDKIRKEHGGSRRRRLLKVLLQLSLPHVMAQAWRVMRHDANNILLERSRLRANSSTHWPPRALAAHGCTCRTARLSSSSTSSAWLLRRCFAGEGKRNAAPSRGWLIPAPMLPTLLPAAQRGLSRRRSPGGPSALREALVEGGTVGANNLNSPFYFRRGAMRYREVHTQGPLLHLES